MNRFTLAMLVFSTAAGSLAARTEGQQPPDHLRVNDALSPVGIDTACPMFGWHVNDNRRGAEQQAYQIVVASSVESCLAGKGDRWDSGRVDSARQNDIAYEGTPLKSRERLWWKVRTWDKEGKAGDWSAPARFELAFLDQSEWTAKWIGGDYERYRTVARLSADKTIVQARAYVSAKEMFELSINGRRIGGERVLEPGFSRFDVRRRYCTYDVTTNLVPGANVFLVSLGRGHLSHFSFKSGEREFLMQVEVRYADGSTSRVVSDQGAWKGTRNGPVVPLPSHKSELYQGVTYDARAEDDAANQAYDDSGWEVIRAARPVAAELPRLVAQTAPPMKATTLITPVAMTQPWPGVYVFDMGQKITGWSQLTVEGPRGATVTMRHGEKLYTSASWADYTFSMNLTIDRVAAGVRFRIADDDNFYLWQFTAGGDLVARKKVKGEWTEIKRVATGLRVGQAYAVKIETQGPVIKTSLDGKPVGIIEDKTFSSGKVGFWQRGLECATFDHILLTPANGWDYSRTGPHSIENGCGDEGLWINRENLVVNRDPSDQKGLHRSFTLTNNERMMSYDGGVTGQVDQSNLHVFSSYHFADATDRYTLKGGGPEVWEPSFTLHGFRWVEVKGFPGVPTLGSIKARVVHQAVDETAGSFSCSDELLNKLHHAYTWTYLNTAQHGMPVDCDQRDERMGWTGDSHCSTQAGFYNYDVISFYDSWMDDLKDTQVEDGAICYVAPVLNVKALGTCRSTTWLSTYIQTPWEAYMATGSKAFLRKRYESLKAFADWCATAGVTNFIDTKNQYGDWAAPKEGALHERDGAGTKGEVLATAFLYRCMTLQARMAEALGHADDARNYAGIAGQVKAAFNARFLDAAAGTYRNELPKGRSTQTANALALGFELCPPELRERVTRSLAVQIADAGNHLMTGVLGTKCLLNALCENGHEEVAFMLATQTTYPSWGKWIQDGLTSTCEFWDTSKSYGHAYLAGPLDAYFYRYLAGITPSKPGYEEICFKPHVRNTLTRVAATVLTVRGPVACQWQKHPDGGFSLAVEVPANAKAQVHIPMEKSLAERSRVAEGGIQFWSWGKIGARHPDVEVAGVEGDYLVCRVGSGQYCFRVERGGN